VPTRGPHWAVSLSRTSAPLTALNPDWDTDGQVRLVGHTLASTGFLCRCSAGPTCQILPQQTHPHFLHGRRDADSSAGDLGVARSCAWTGSWVLKYRVIGAQAYPLPSTRPLAPHSLRNKPAAAVALVRRRHIVFPVSLIGGGAWLGLGGPVSRGDCGVGASVAHGFLTGDPRIT
jgi:hypothetical protein